MGERNTKKCGYVYIHTSQVMFLRINYIFSWLAFLSPQVFDLEIIILNNYLIAFENCITDEMYPGKDIVIFFTTVSEQLANDHFFVLIWGAETYRWLQKKELSTLGPSVNVIYVIFRLHSGKNCRAKFQPVKTCLPHLLSVAGYHNNNIADKNNII